jgi:hypothetical protein
VILKTIDKRKVVTQELRIQIKSSVTIKLNIFQAMDQVQHLQDNQVDFKTKTSKGLNSCLRIIVGNINNHINNMHLSNSHLVILLSNTKILNNLNLKWDKWDTVCHNNFNNSSSSKITRK